MRHERSATIRKFRYDVFISYRRGQGAETARLLKSELEKCGYRVFLDVSDLSSGHYDEALLRSIKSSHSFVVILTPGALDSCSTPEDWLRKEIACALESHCCVVPVRMPGFEFPPMSNMPPCLADLPQHQAVDYNHSLFDAVLLKLCGYLGKPRFGLWRRIGPRARAILVVAGLVVVGGGVYGIRTYLTASTVSETVPLSTQDASLLKSLANDMCGQLTQVNGMLVDVADMGRKGGRAMDGRDLDERKLKDIADECRFHIAEIKRTIRAPMWTAGSHADDLNRLGVPTDEIYAFYSLSLPPFWEELEKFYEKTAQRAELPRSGRLGSEGRVTELDAECLQLEAQLMHYGLLGLLSHFPREAVVDFHKFSGQWTQLDVQEIMNQDAADSAMERTIQRIENINDEISALVGNEQVSVQKAQNKLDDLRAEAARQNAREDPELVALRERVKQKQDALTNKQAEVAAAETRLEAVRTELREQCRIADGDNLYVMWQKVLKLHKVGLTDDERRAIERMRALLGDKEPGLDTCLGAARAFWARQSDYSGAGVMVMFFENDAPHSFLRRGDILLSLNGKALATEADFQHAPRIEGGHDTVEFLRFGNDGQLMRHKETGTGKNPRLAVVELF